MKILISKAGLDEHTWAARVVADGLMRAGMEVVYIEMVTPEEIVQAALQEDVHIVGVSIYSGAHLVLLPKIVRLMRQNGIGEVPVIAGGCIPDEDVATLKSQGIAEVFGTGTLIKDVVEYINNLWGSRQHKAQS